MHRESEIFHWFNYPAGEVHTEMLEVPTGPILARCQSFEDLCRVVTEDRILKRRHIAVTWLIPYFPFARHDRRNHRGDGFELGLALDLVKELDVVVIDPHSSVAGMLPHITQASVVTALPLYANDYLVAIPDAGAAHKAYTWITGDYVQCSKVRNPATGKLSGFSVPPGTEGRHVLIVDDICDGGGTFIGLRKAMPHAASVTLAVTHGLFTQGIGQLSEAFDQIYSFHYESDYQLHDGKLTTFSYASLYEPSACH